MFKSKKLFIGCGFINSQLLWLIPLADGYCEKKKINTLIFQSKLSKEVYENHYIKKILKKYKIVYLENTSFILKYPIIKFFYLIFKIVPLAILKSLSINKKKMINKSINWYDYQLNHAIWDQAMRGGVDGDIEPKLKNIFKSSIIAYYNIFQAKLALKGDCKDFFLGHSVYGHRAFLLKVRLNQNNIFCHSGFTLYRQYSKTDNSWCFLKKERFNFLSKKIKKKEINNYWSLRNLGKGNYVDSRIASNIKFVKKKNIDYTNVIFLHIFRDSPFADIDKERIYIDYSHWIENTLKIISKTKENWILRLHPSYKRWGENQLLALNKIINKTFATFPNNITVDDNSTPNTEVFKKAKRVITFNGTSHLEAACNGIKPIVISNTMLNKLNSKIIFKPKSQSYYKKLLMMSSDTQNFKLNKEEVSFSKKVLYIREKALKFETEVGGFHVFTRDSKKKMRQDFMETKTKLKNNMNFLKKNGKLLTNKNDITLSKQFI
jgi:hypothetical protein